MTPAERRAAALRLLAKIDQEIAEAESLVSDPLLDERERRYVHAQLNLRRETVKRVERIASSGR